MNLRFDNTEVAFSSKTDADLDRAYWLFKMVSAPSLVNFGKVAVDAALAVRFPISWAIKPTIFRHFCGGETVEESKAVVNSLGKFHVKSILDYSIEGKESENDFDNCRDAILSIIKEASKNSNIGFAVFKPTGVARLGLMEKVSSGAPLSDPEKTEWARSVSRFDAICKASYDAGLPVFIDAEESWIQQAVDDVVNAMMAKYNKQRAIVYNTFQLYRHDRLAYLRSCYESASKAGYHIGAKLVRGAYMEKERERAAKKNYPSPINPTKDASDRQYNEALIFCLDHLDRISFCCASHNEESSMLVVNEMTRRGLPPSHPNIYFSQLLGMSDHISFNLSAAGYNVSKYVPFGPVKDVLPYLIRRAQENTSVKGQTGRELSLILKERKRRRS